VNRVNHTLVIALALILSLFANRSSAQGSLFNADFEQPELRSDAGGWSMPESCRKAGFRAGITAVTPAQGASCAVVSYEGEGATEGMGNLIQGIDARELRGKVVSFSASVRVEGDGRAQLWLRTDGANDFSVLIDNMHDRPVKSAQWWRYEIRGYVDPRSDRLVMGMMLFDGGRAYLDDVKIAVLGDLAEVCEPPRALEARGLENLVAFAKLLGYVAFFHPSDEAKSVDWVSSTPKLDAIESAPDDAELAKRLQALFEPFAPTVQIFETQAPPPKHADLARRKESDRLKLVRWRNVGFARNDESPLYFRRRDKQRLKDEQPPEGWSWPDETWDAELVPGVSCRVPLVVWSDSKGTLPRAPSASGKFDQVPFQSGNDRATRIADVILAWNVFQHFYPYFDVVEVDWPKELEKALMSAATDADEVAFARTLRRLVAALRDGHGRVVTSVVRDVRSSPPIELCWVEDKLVVLSVPRTCTLTAGEVIVSIDGERVSDVWSRLAPLMPAATPQFARYQALGQVARGIAGTKVVLESQTADGKLHTNTLTRALEPVEERRRETFSELEPGIFYFDLGHGTDEDFEAALPRLAQAKGIVFDLRGYPTLGADFFGHLTSKPLESPQWLVPTPRFPDRKDLSFNRSQWKVKPLEPRFEAKVAFLTDGRAISAAETYMGIADFHDLGTIVGEPTAGTNGNVNPFSLPGGYEISWTGMKVLRQDGTRHHGVGIQPDVPCSRTIAGIAAGRDEQLEKAIEIVKR
jgi:hypothetical protein